MYALPLAHSIITNIETAKYSLLRPVYTEDAPGVVALVAT